VTPRNFAWRVALGDTHLRFTWHAWRLATFTFVSRGSLWHWARSGGSLGARGPLVARRGDIRRGLATSTSTFFLRGRRGTWRHPPIIRFVWQVGRPGWRLATSTCTLRGRRGTWRHPPAWHAWRLATSTFVWRGKRGAW